MYACAELSALSPLRSAAVSGMQPTSLTPADAAYTMLAFTSVTSLRW